eukprot:351810-Chlamydomonas_euryale.AAC.7
MPAPRCTPSLPQRHWHTGRAGAPQRRQARLCGEEQRARAAAVAQQRQQLGRRGVRHGDRGGRPARGGRRHACNGHGVASGTAARCRGHGGWHACQARSIKGGQGQGGAAASRGKEGQGLQLSEEHGHVHAMTKWLCIRGLANALTHPCGNLSVPRHTGRTTPAQGALVCLGATPSTALNKAHPTTTQNLLHAFGRARAAVAQLQPSSLLLPRQQQALHRDAAVAGNLVERAQLGETRNGRARIVQRAAAANALCQHVGHARQLQN